MNKTDDKFKVNEKLYRKFVERFGEDEIKRLLSGSKPVHNKNAYKYNFKGDSLCVGLCTDTHLGSVYTDPELLYKAFDVFAEVGVDFIAICGDIHEGLSHRPGHMYECSHIGYSAQLDHSREVFSRWKETDIFMIDGNHDRWYIKSNGAIIVDELCRGQENLHFLGHDEGDIKIKDIIIKLWHGEDTGSYAYSYRIQKLVESFTGGEKPNILFCGHTHKAFPMFCRHIHCVSAGAIQRQSKWMRSKRQESHTSFYVVKMGICKSGVSWFESRHYPFYI